MSRSGVPKLRRTRASSGSRGRVRWGWRQHPVDLLRPFAVSSVGTAGGTAGPDPGGPGQLAPRVEPCRQVRSGAPPIEEVRRAGAELAGLPGSPNVS